MTRKYESTDVRQKQILVATKKIIIKSGAENLTIKRIAREVGISETAIYRHFKKKNEILSFLIKNIGEIMTQELNEIDREANVSIVDAIKVVIRNHLSSIEQKRGVTFQFIAEIISLGDKKLNHKVSIIVDNYIETVKSLLAEGVKTGEIRDDIDLDAAATVLFGLIQGLTNIWALKDYKFDPMEKYESLWSIYREAIIKR